MIAFTPAGLNNEAKMPIPFIWTVDEHPCAATWLSMVGFSISGHPIPIQFMIAEPRDRGHDGTSVSLACGTMLARDTNGCTKLVGQSACDIILSSEIIAGKLKVVMSPN